MAKRSAVPAPMKVPTKPMPEEIDLTRTEAAWAKFAPRARALPSHEVRDARLDVTLAVAIARGGARNVLAQRARLEEEFQRAPFEVFERVEEVGLAALHADLLHRAASDTVAPFADLLPRVNELRGALLDDLAAQVRRKRAPARLLEDIRAGDNSVRDKANDLNDLAQWYRANWSALAGKTTVEATEVPEASELAAKVLARLGAVMAAQAPKEGEASTSELRRRAFTLLARDYDVLRRYGAFLFFDLPAGWEAYVPSLWSGRASEGPAKGEPLPPTPLSPPTKPE